jgi:hypothetical protein
VKAEPPALSPAIALFLWVVRRSRSEPWAHAAVVFGLAALVVSPWLARNHRVAGRIILSANSGETVFNCNHSGASGRPDNYVARRFVEACRRETAAATTLEADRRGWELARRFVREHPLEALGIAARKLRFTYASDADGERLIRFGKGDLAEWSGSREEWRWKLSPSTSRRLRLAADLYWFAILGLSALGLFTVRSWPPGSAVLVCGVVVTWLGIHVVFCGSPRYHVPETPAYALLAACGLRRCAALAGGARPLRA